MLGTILKPIVSVLNHQQSSATCSMDHEIISVQQNSVLPRITMYNAHTYDDLLINYYYLLKEHQQTTIKDLLDRCSIGDF